MTTCLMSTSVPYHMPAKSIFFWGSTGMEITGPHTANWTCDWLCTSGTLWTNLPTVNSLVPSDFHHFWPCHLASDTWHQQLLCQDTSLESRCVKCLNISSDYVEVWYVTSATMCHVYTKVSRRYLASKCLSPNFLYSFVVLYLCCGMLHLICHRWKCGM